MRDFRKLEVWHLARAFVAEVYQLTYSFPANEKFGLVSQINRSAVSIPANVAEGCARGTEKDFIRFIEISLGSSFELETYFYLAKDLKYCTEELSDDLIARLNIIQRKLNALKNSFKPKV